MAEYTATPRYFNRALAMGSWLLLTPVHADSNALDLFVGNWQIQVTQLQPETSKLTYTEVYERVLDGKYIRGETARKPDGTQDIVFATYDATADNYLFWIFSSSGSYTYLPQATWNAKKRLMKWKNPSQFDISYESKCEFPSNNLRSCHLIMKDWKGKVLSELAWTAERQAE
jgi:hypothetical protein